MEDGQQADRDEDHGPLEDHERDLVVGQTAREPVLQLGDTVRAPDEDGDGRERERRLEQPEPRVGPQGGEGRVHGRAPAGAAPHRDGEVAAEDHEDGERGDLEGQARDHDVDARVLQGGARVGDGGDGAAGGLQHERDDVAGDEDDGVGAGAEAGEGLAVDDDEAAEGEVD